MKKLFAKIEKIFLIATIMVPYFGTPMTVQAKSGANTLAELRKELAQYKAKASANESNKKATQSEINSKRNAIITMETEIENNRVKIAKAKEDIVSLEKDIEETKEKIENILRTYEVSDGDNNYLEYIFNATSISDLIIRYSISEQLASYNDELISGYEEKITENEQLQIDLKNKEEENEKKISEYESSISNLGNKLDDYIDEAVSIEDDIKSTQELIDQYVKIGCGENETFEACLQVKGSKNFIKPLNKGMITSHFGYRYHPITGTYKLHTGTDIGGNSEGTNVYAAANGRVGKIIWRASCGGNQVYIYHTIDGVKYTSGYMHLLTINVNVGDTVTTNSVIGTVGGGRGTSSYETCSTGAHLHFMIGKGWYGSTYVAYSSWTANLLNPVNVIKFPASYVYFYSRY